MEMKAKRFLLCGVFAPIVFVIMLIIFSVLTPSYSNITDGVSELGVVGAPFALYWNILGFISVGMLIIAFAWGLRQSMRTGPGSVIVPILVALSGLGFAGLGMFPASEGYAPSNQTTLHLTMVSINFLTFILMTFIYAIKLKSEIYWNRWSGFSSIIGILAVASFFIPKSIPGGISQRFGLGAYFLWLLVIGMAAIRRENASKP